MKLQYTLQFHEITYQLQSRKISSSSIFKQLTIADFLVTKVDIQITLSWGKEKVVQAVEVSQKFLQKDLKSSLARG